MRTSDAAAIVDAVPKIAGLLGGEGGQQRMSMGERAALRRLDPDAPESGIGAVCRTLLRAGVAVEQLRSEDLSRAALAVHVLALLSGSGVDPHDPRTPAGKGLAAAGLSEGRFRRFLTARGSAFREQVPRLARFLAGRSQRLDCRLLVWLILIEGDDEDAAEQVRLRLARDFYAALYRQNHDAAGADAA